MRKCFTAIVDEYHGVNRAMNYEETDEEKASKSHDHFFAERTRQKLSKPIHSLGFRKLCIRIKILPEPLVSKEEIIL
jgi:hypothetical protein